MKILFISKGDLPDYQCDSFFNGGRTLFGENFIDANYIWYMYEDQKKLHWNDRVPDNGRSYGRGFTIAGSLKDIPINRENLRDRILDKVFDLIIYGSCVRCTDYISEVTKVYNKNQIIFIDGEDDAKVREYFLQYGHLFKRELVKKTHENLHPINFGIPETKIINQVSKKTQDWGTVIPGKLDTYVFFDEESYYSDYQKSYFALTHKKGGWDCMRHYEIMANGCVPYFPDIDNCPELTMKTFPKSLCKDAIKMVDSGEIDDDKYYNLANNFLNFTRENLTSKNIVVNVLNQIK